VARRAGNYVLAAGTTSATASITAKSVSATLNAGNKQYDGNTNASATGSVYRLLRG
jgi:hypothetical protein